jgi:TRAP-type C4-dicarboxylate transport system substrate-binding protein
MHSITAMLQNKYYDAAPYVTIGYFIPNVMACTINTDTYNSLPKEMQDAISTLGQQITDNCNDYYVSQGYPGSIDKLAKAGANVIRLSPAERAKFADAMKATNDADFAAGGDLGKRAQQVSDEVNKLYPYSDQ